jgi:hypothetical protein
MPAGRQLITALPEFIAKKMMDAVLNCDDKAIVSAW